MAYLIAPIHHLTGPSFLNDTHSDLLMERPFPFLKLYYCTLNDHLSLFEILT